MDKTMKRKIGYKKPVQTLKTKVPAKPRPPKVASAPKTAPEMQGKPTAQDIYKFLKEHPLIKIGGLCKIIGTDKSNFYTSMKNGANLSEEIVAKIVKELKNYGYPA